MGTRKRTKIAKIQMPTYVIIRLFSHGLQLDNYAL